MKIQHKIFFLFTTILVIMALLILTVSPISVYADKVQIQSNQIVNNDAINIYLSKTDIDKTAGSKGELKTATYLSEFLESQNCEYFNGSESYLQEFNIGYAQTSNNVIGVKKSKIDTKNSIVIASHYDNTYEKNKSIGALESATGVVLLMGLIQTLKNYEFDFNIIYCFFGASNLDLQGSKAFINSLDRESKHNLLLNINLDSIGCGEHTYYYAGDSANSFVKAFDFNAFSINQIPTYSKTKFILTSQNLAYSNAGLSGDNIPFLNEKIKSISFFSGNLDGLNAGFKESGNNANKITAINTTIGV